MNSIKASQYQNLDIKHLAKLEVSREFYDNLHPITALDFDGDGEFCVTASADETINLYNCRNGNHEKFSASKKYGVHLTRFTHSSDEIIYASTKENGRVVALEMSPTNDQFLTGSVNEGIRLWDLKQPNDVGFIDLKAERPCVGYDPSGLVFAIAIQHPHRTVQLYDSRKFDESPFSTFKVEDNYAIPSVSGSLTTKIPVWTGIKFGNDGHKILITTSGDVHYIIDAFDGQIKQRLVGHMGLDNASAFLGGEETSFTPDGRYVISGSRDGKIHFWDTLMPIESSGSSELVDTKPFHTLNHHILPTQVVRFNPQKLLLVSACRDLVSFQSSFFRWVLFEGRSLFPAIFITVPPLGEPRIAVLVRS
ncbi:13198_t:CDS:2 [Acaulospora morrowiae]|uniref:13198_t:CDS:1 n=1 Tax=Acaulospora morrowiae TaxID=94023 RepID=A0A9N8YNZ9_9GLOM|nr:13198_t:CDS:2 [Acaulospora morrowiae]